MAHASLHPTSVSYLTDSADFPAHNRAIVVRAPAGAGVSAVKSIGTAMADKPPLDQGSFDPESTSRLIKAFEAAWQTVLRSGSPLASPERADTTRELLARYLIARVQAGERDEKTLIADALVHLTASQ